MKCVENMNFFLSLQDSDISPKLEDKLFVGQMFCTPNFLMTRGVNVLNDIAHNNDTNKCYFYLFFYISRLS